MNQGGSMNKIGIDFFKEVDFISQLKGQGNFLSYVVSRAEIEKNDYTSSIYLYDIKNKNHRRLTSGKKDGAYLWLDDENIVFRGQRGEVKESKAPETVFYKINIRGGEAEVYLTLPYAVQKIVFLNDKECLFTAAYVKATDKIKALEGHEKEDYLNSLEDEEDYEVIEEIPFWFNGDTYLRGRRTALYHYDTETQKAVKLTEDQFDVQRFTYDEAYQTAYVSGETFEGMAGLYNHIYELKGNQLVQITPAEDFSYGEWIQVSENELVVNGSDLKEYGINENGKFYLLNKSDQSLKLLTPEFNQAISNAIGSDLRIGNIYSDYQKLNNKVVFPVLDHFTNKLLSLDLEGNIETFIDTKASLDEFICHQGVFYGICLTKDGAQEIYNLKEMTPLSDYNTSLLSEYDVRPSEHFVFKNRAGIEIDGFVIKPSNFDDKQKYPTILDVHGGPKTVYGDVLYHEMQYWANEGYVVIFCNPRGSDGGDSDFSDIRGKYGTIDYEDIMDFVDETLRRYHFIDVDKMGVTGGSYGGFMTNWIIGHTDRFKAAASQRSIANWTGFFGTSDIGYYFAPDQVGATPWSDIEKVWQQSPLKYADQVTTPTLFIHSKEDYRCNIPEGYQMFTALKFHGVDSKLVLFRGENHELSRSGKPKHRIRRLKEITDWMDQYLKG